MWVCIENHFSIFKHNRIWLMLERVWKIILANVMCKLLFAFSNILQLSSSHIKHYYRGNLKNLHKNFYFSKILRIFLLLERYVFQTRSSSKLSNCPAKDSSPTLYQLQKLHNCCNQFLTIQRFRQMLIHHRHHNIHQNHVIGTGRLF